LHSSIRNAGFGGSAGRALTRSAPDSAAAQAAVRQVLQQTPAAVLAVKSLSQQGRLAGRIRGGGHATHGKAGGGKRHASPPEPPVAAKGGGGESHTGGGESHTAGGESHTAGGESHPVAATAASTSAAAPPSSAATTGPPASVPLVPQLAAVASQPLGLAAARTRPATSRSHSRVGHVTSPLAPLIAAAPAVGGTASSRAAAASPGSAKVAHAAARSRSGGVLEGFGGQIPLPIPVPDWSKPVIVALLLLALALAVRAAAAGARARRLERQSAGLLRDLGAMQAALVPELPARVGGLDVSVAYRPAEGPAAGGDFYDLFEPRPGVVAMMLGDVSGHGHEALTHAALARYTLRAYLQAGLEPRMALALAGRVLNDPTGARYATVAVGIYDAAAGTLSYSLAGHPPPVFVGAPGIEPVTACSSPPVGWGVPTGRRQTTVSLAPGSEVCFFSDGLVEARREGRLLGRQHLRQLLAGLGPHPQSEQLLEEVRRAAPTTPDDMVACILSAPNSPAVASVHVEELEVDARALQRSGVRRFLCECRVAPAQLSSALRRASELVSSTGGAFLRVEVAASSTVQVTAAPFASADVKAARGQRTREQLALASFAVAT
jgi:hypothetical protein